MKILLAFSVALVCWTSISCSPSPRGAGGSARYAAFDLPASRPMNPANVEVKVSIRNQAAYVMEGNRPLLVMPVAVGTQSKPTPLGNFRIFKKAHKHRANSHGYASKDGRVTQTWLAKKPAGWNFKGTPMPYWCEFKAHYGFHTGWMKPYPCTHGCLRMHENLAPKFYHLVQVGTPVTIATTLPEDSPSVGKFPALQMPCRSPITPIRFILERGISRSTRLLFTVSHMGGPCARPQSRTGGHTGPLPITIRSPSASSPTPKAASNQGAARWYPDRTGGN